MRYIGSLTLVVFMIAFVSCKKTDKKQNSKEEEKVALEAAMQKGNQLVKMTFESISGKLKSTIVEKGAVEAIQYCNVEAVPLTTALEEDGIKISRTSTNFRNPNNAPNKESRAILAKYAENKANGVESKSIVQKGENGNIHYYKPIYMKALCLNCHGDAGSNVSEEVVSQLNKLYPQDKAMGYKLDDLRGAWHIEFVD